MWVPPLSGTHQTPHHIPVGAVILIYAQANSTAASTDSSSKSIWRAPQLKRLHDEHASAMLTISRLPDWSLPKTTIASGRPHWEPQTTQTADFRLGCALTVVSGFLDPSMPGTQWSTGELSCRITVTELLMTRLVRLMRWARPSCTLPAAR